MRDAWKLSQAALSALLPTAPTDRVALSWSQRSAKTLDTYRAPSNGHLSPNEYERRHHAAKLTLAA